ncbi:ion transporter [Thiohalorhabdus sp.]|uniref:ion transporter n=1 Tax=Thiohalorhabdus sp. TaxID=3094134 RepID=UPI002FC38579
MRSGREGDWRSRLGQWVESQRIQRLITVLILVNAVTLGLETSDRAMAAAGGLLTVLDRAVVAVFVVEIASKLVAFRAGFWRSGWNVFDFVVVAVSVIPAGEQFAVLRALRVLRVLRLTTVVPQMRQVVGSLLGALPGMASIVGVLVLIFYVAGVMATKLFGDRFPDDFGSIAISMYTLFQIMTLESWSEAIVRPVMEVYPYAWLFFIPFIVITAFAVLNLFMALIVDSMQKLHEAEWEEERAEIEDVGARERAAIEGEVAALREEVQGLRRDLAEDGAAAEPDGTGEQDPG